ncbi:hypothetical protein RZN05_07825 [Sphingomonas sp. HF-S4]|uniref:Uncharacterized protein n=1 Tax=Sphingomonas agrestis TaxID=3080540 RepID=A0ABU3Y670_9SPHN|nr:hypothetical protein [Sphingomonas sp. HF-S4]MDV3456886.1 hypothetical protein [Sphingomonas sp. HF-S4]
MAKSATDLMQEILFSTVLDSIVALKGASNGLPNLLVREVNSIHPNTTLADLPKDMQAAIAANVRSAFAKLLKEGYSVAPQGAEPRRASPAGAAPVHRPRGGGGERRPPRGGGQGPKRGPGGLGSKPPRPPRGG